MGWLGTHTTRDSINREAQVHSFDGRYFTKDGKWDMRWQATTSRVNQDGEAENGYGAWLDFNYSPKRGYYHWMELVYWDDKIDINDLGFLWRNDQRWLGYAFEKNNNDVEGMRSVNTTIRTSFGKNRAGQTIGSDIRLFFTRSYLNNTKFEFKLMYFPKRWDDLISRGNGAIKIGDESHIHMAWDSDLRKKVGFLVNSFSGNCALATKYLTTDLSLYVIPYLITWIFV